jgi:hypothetical protein
MPLKISDIRIFGKNNSEPIQPELTGVSYPTPACATDRTGGIAPAPWSDLSVAPRFLWVGIELGRGLEGGGLPPSPFRSARQGRNSTKAASPEALCLAR